MKNGRMLATRRPPTLTGGVSFAEGGQRSMGLRVRRSERRVSVERVFVEQIELLAWIVIRFWLEGLVMTADLGEVGRLELQGDLHEHVGNVSGGLIGGGVFRQF
jgi:hypothetical protein